MISSYFIFKFKADENIHIRRNADFILYSKNPINPIGSKDDIKKTVDYKFIEMYPIFPTVDLLTENIFYDNNCIGWSEKIHNPFKYVHTIFHINDDSFDTNTDLARLIMFAFGYAHAQAKLNKEVSI